MLPQPLKLRQEQALDDGTFYGLYNTIAAVEWEISVAVSLMAKLANNSELVEQLLSLNRKSSHGTGTDSSKSATEAALTSYPKERQDGSILVKNEEARRSVRSAFKVGEKGWPAPECKEYILRGFTRSRVARDVASSATTSCVPQEIILAHRMYAIVEAGSVQLSTSFSDCDYIDIDARSHFA